MHILNDTALESNKYMKINFNGDLSSGAGLLLFKKFLFKFGTVKLINRVFKTTDTASFRVHKDGANLMQVIYQIISAYFEDDYADELTNEPVITAILDKDALASQPKFCSDRWSLSFLGLLPVCKRIFESFHGKCIRTVTN
jgi:hypothetical protein